MRLDRTSFVRFFAGLPAIGIVTISIFAGHMPRAQSDGLDDGLGLRPEIILLNDNRSPEALEAASKSGVLLSKFDFPAEIRDDITTLMKKFANLVRETSRTQDGKKVYVAIEDTAIENAYFRRLGPDSVVVTATVGLLEKAPNDDYLVGLIGHEFEHGHSKIQKRANDEPHYLRYKGLKRAVEGEVDILGSQRVIEQGRNPYAMMMFFERNVEEADDISEMSTSHLGSRSRLAALGANIANQIRGQGKLNHIRVDINSARTELTDFASKNVFGNPIYVTARYERIFGSIKYEGGWTANNYKVLGTVLGKPPSDWKDVGMTRYRTVGFNANSTWQNLSDRAPSSMSASQALTVQEEIVKQIAMRSDAERAKVINLPGIRSPMALEFLLLADSREPYINLESPIGSYAKMEKRRIEFESVPAIEKIRKVQAEALYKEAQKNWQDSLTPFEADGVHAKSMEDVAKNIKSLFDSEGFGSRKSSTLLDAFGKSEDVGSHYRMVNRLTGLRVKGPIHELFVQEGLRPMKLIRDYLDVLSSPNTPSAEMAHSVKSIFAAAQGELSSEEIKQIFDGIKARSALEWSQNPSPELFKDQHTVLTEFPELIGPKKLAWRNEWENQYKTLLVEHMRRAPDSASLDLVKGHLGDDEGPLSEKTRKFAIKEYEIAKERVDGGEFTKLVQELKQSKTWSEFFTELKRVNAYPTLDSKQRVDIYETVGAEFQRRLKESLPRLTRAEFNHLGMLFNPMPVEIKVSFKDRMRAIDNLGKLISLSGFENLGLSLNLKSLSEFIGNAEKWDERSKLFKVAGPIVAVRPTMWSISDVVSSDESRLIKQVSYQEARKKPASMIFTNHAGEKKLFVYKAYWREFHATRLRANSAFSARKAYERATYETLQQMDSLGIQFSNAKSGDFLYNFADWSPSQARSGKHRAFDWDRYFGTKDAIEKFAKERKLDPFKLWPKKMAEKLVKNPSILKDQPYERVAMLLDQEIKTGRWEPSFNGDQVIKRVLSQRGDREVAFLLENPKLVTAISDGPLKVEVAKRQVADDLQFKSALKTRNVKPGTSRTEVRSLSQLILSQFPEPGVERDTMVNELEKELSASRAESKVLDSLRLKNSYADLKGLEFADLPDHLSGLLKTPEDHMRFLSYLIDRTQDIPTPNWLDLPAELSKESVAKDWQRLAIEIKARYLRSGAAQRAVAINFLLDENKGVLASEELRQKLRSWLLGSREKSVVARRVYVDYLNNLPISEAKLLIVGALTQYNPRRLNPVNLSLLTDIAGPLGGKGGQAVAQSGMVDASVRADLSDVHNMVQIPERWVVTRDVERVLGKNANLIESVGKVRGSGSINYLVEVGLRNPKTGKVENLLLRIQKENVAGKIANENVIWEKVAKGMADDTDPPIRRAGRLLEQVREQSWQTLKPDGIELNMEYETSPEVVAAAKATYERDIPDPKSGFRSKIAASRSDLVDLVSREFRGKAMFVDPVAVTDWDNIRDKKLRAALARQAQALEIDGALIGRVDKDGHKGNWMPSLETRELVRTDYAQMQTQPASEKVQNDLREILGGLIDPRKAGERRTDEAILSHIKTVFKIEGTLADGSPAFQNKQVQDEVFEVVRNAMLKRDFPAAHSPIDRLLFLQGAVEEHFMRNNKVTGFAFPIRTELSDMFASLRRAASLGEYAGPMALSEHLAQRLNLDIKFFSAQMAYQWSRDQLKASVKSGRERVADAARAKVEIVSEKLGAFGRKSKIKEVMLDTKVEDVEKRCPNIFSVFGKLARP